MLERKNRLSATAALAAVLLLFAFAAAPPARACLRIPSTLLDLYLKSDLIVVADYTGERLIERQNENKHGFTAKLERELAVARVLKGPDGQEDLRSLSFVDFEYRTKPDPARQKAAAEANLPNFTVVSFGRGHRVTVGQRYLFFLNRNAETGLYLKTDPSSAVKSIEQDLHVYEKFIGRLNEIAAAPEKDRPALITEWLVAGIEEPAIRWDASYDLYKSINALERERENPEKHTGARFEFGKNFNSFTPAFAKSLTERQKNRIDAVLSENIQRAWFSAEAKSAYVDYQLIRIVSSWDRERLAVYGFGVLQSLPESDWQKRSEVMSFISTAVGDQKLFELRSEYAKKSSARARLLKAVPTEIAAKLAALKTAENDSYRSFLSRFQFMHARGFAPVKDKPDGGN